MQNEITVKISRNDRGNPPDKLAEAELHFNTGALAGLKLIGFGIWQRRNGAGRNVTFPARQYSVNGERRAFALLRPDVDSEPIDRLTRFILDEYDRQTEEYERNLNDADQQQRAIDAVPALRF